MFNIKKKFKFLNLPEKYSLGNIPLTEVFPKIGMILALVIIIPFLFPSGRSFKYTDLTEGNIASKKVIAPFDFSVLKPENELQKERAEARNAVPAHFSLDDSVQFNQVNRFQEFLASLEKVSRDYFDPEKEIDKTTDPLSMKRDSLTYEIAREQTAVKYKLNLTSKDIEIILRWIKDDGYSSSKQRLLAEFKALGEAYYINISKEEMHNDHAVIIINGIEEIIPLTSLVDESEINSYIDTRLEIANLYNRSSLLKIFSRFLSPNFLYLENLTEQRRLEAVAAVARGKDLVFENERIVDANERITKEIYQKLYSLEVAIAEKSELEGDLQNILSQLGKFLLTALILILYVLYLSANRKKIFRDNKKLLLISILILGQVGIGALIIGPLGWSSYVIPTTISSMLLGILFDPGIGLVGTVVIGLILAGITGFDYAFAVLIMFVGIVAIYSVTRIRTRNQIFKAILYIMSAYLVVIFTLGTLRYEGFQEIFQNFIFYLLPNAILSPFITYMMLGVFEKLFDVTTDVTLLELSDLNHPLLKELSVKAPGTFHHSIIVGNLSESAALTIGANSLLARVGSYYHDIGKMIKPEYFVENQKGKTNRHEGLAPNMSALILTSHVKNGLELAEKSSLPKIIRDFIPEHHGKNLMGYFYNKALEEKNSKDVNETDYRYPGPSPKSRETAIVMLADTIEAATRTLNHPSAGRLRKQVEELVEQRFLEGELDDSDLTMRDLKGIIDGFMSVLLGIYHQRIEYPKADDLKKIANKQSSKKGKVNKVTQNGNSNSR